MTRLTSDEAWVGLEGEGMVAWRASMATMACVEGIHGARDGARVL